MNKNGLMWLAITVLTGIIFGVAIGHNQGINIGIIAGVGICIFAGGIEALYIIINKDKKEE